MSSPALGAKQPGTDSAPGTAARGPERGFQHQAWKLARDLLTSSARPPPTPLAEELNGGTGLLSVLEKT